MNESLTIPNAIVAYNSKVLYNSYRVLEGQLSNTPDPVVRKDLDNITQRVFDSWVALGHKENGGVNCAVGK